jgi:uncharacterized metal-binding protein
MGQVARDQIGDILDSSVDKIWRETDPWLADIPMFRIEYPSYAEWAKVEDIGEFNVIMSVGIVSIRICAPVTVDVRQRRNGQ